jgi:haloalkane dehalogenase
MPHTSVLSSTIHHREVGAGAPVVFLHGNPTSSYLWRKILGAVGPGVRSLAPDLIGMGESGKPDDIAYTFADHATYLGAWIEALGLDTITLVGHDWGGALALDWAARHPDRVCGLSFFETIVRPMQWDDLPESARPVFKNFRDRGPGERLVLEENVFIEQALPFNIKHLAPEDHEIYRAPYPTPASRRPLLAWPRSMPISGEPADVDERVRRYDKWLSTSEGIPKLHLTFHDGPGLMGPAVAAWCRDNIVDLETVDCGDAGHHAPEDQPDAIAAAISSWLDRHGLRDTGTTPGGP